MLVRCASRHPPISHVPGMKLDLHLVPLSRIDPGGNYDVCEDACTHPRTDHSSHLDQYWVVAHGANPTKLTLSLKLEQ